MTAAVSENKSLLAFDAVFPRRDEVLCGDAMRENFARLLKSPVERCEIARVKYRPQKSLRVLFRVKTGDETSLLTARMFSGTRGGEVSEISKAGQQVFHDEKLKTVFWKFPFDRKISELEKIVGETNCRKEIVAYAPEKCATFRYFNRQNEPFAYAKIFADGAEAERIYSIYKDLPRAIEDLFPRAACFSPKNKTLLVEAVKGARLADLEAKNLSSAFYLFGAALARFHELKPSENLKEFSRHKPDKIFATLEIIKLALPGNFTKAEKLARNLTRNNEFNGEETVTLHGDVHAKNAILQPDGKLVLIDLDQVSIGNAASDIGSFLAGLFYKETTGEILAETRKTNIENFLAGYETVRALPNRKSLNWHTAAAIFTERCGRAISRFRKEGLENFARLLDLSDEILQGGKM